MDVHPPHSPIRSVRDFLLQIFTITCGIVIALTLEAVVTWRENEHLAQVTRQDFREELGGNLTNLQKAKPELASDFTWLLAMIAYGDATLHHQEAKRPDLLKSRSFVMLSKSAWDTALATQAIHHLRIAEARQLASAYSKQTALNDLEDHAEHQWITLAAFGDLDSLQENEARTALADLRVAAAYTGSIIATEDTVINAYKAAIEEISK